MFQCNFCSKHFESISALNKHQKTENDCLDYQIQLINLEENRCSPPKQGKQVMENHCEYCNRYFSGQKGLQCHKIVCPKKQQKEIESIIQECERKIDNLKRKHQEEIKHYQQLLLKTNQNLDHLLEQHIEETYCKE